MLSKRILQNVFSYLLSAEQEVADNGAPYWKNLESAQSLTTELLTNSKNEEAKVPHDVF
jgi:hypothetical protein